MTMKDQALTFEILYDCDDWPELDAVTEKCFESVINSGIKGVREGVVTLLFTSDPEIRRLNSTFRNRDKATNVLSFPAAPMFQHELEVNGGPPIGDIALAFETCHMEAMDKGISFEHHMAHLIFHGILHLFGYDHETDHDAQIMEGHEVNLLAGMGIANPYEV